MNQHHITVTVSRRIFGENIRLLRQLAAPAKVCVVMKADAFGHGLAGLVGTAVDAGADVIGVCTNPEAEIVRQQVGNVPIMRLRMALPEELDESLERLDIEEQVGSWEVAEYLDRAGRHRGLPVIVHLKIDTGMGRGGFYAGDLQTIKRVCVLPGLRIAGVMTHLARADGVSLDHSRRQLDYFDSLVAELSAELPDDVLLHSHNSAAAVRLPESRRDIVRLGAVCYGVRTSLHFANPEGIRPVMAVKSRIAQVREMAAGTDIGYSGSFTTTRASLIASIPAGFGEGYPRSLSNKGIVLIDGRRCPVVGRVSLNVTTVDVTDLPRPPKWGDEVVLIGEQGSEAVAFEEMANAFGGVYAEISLMAGLMNAVDYVD